MSTPRPAPSTVTTSHLVKLAYVYIRQSSLSQVNRHSESTELQYRLCERAVALGWPRQGVEVIDDDLGKSGATADCRRGFQHLIAEIGLARVGLVLSLDASRLARNNGDWYQLIELCSIFGTLIADGEKLYDPRAYHDRLLLGLSGMMSEAELHHLKLRLQAGAQNKARRGELRQTLPVGYVRVSGEVCLHPDEEVQARLRLVFQKFDQIGDAVGVLRYFLRKGLPLPTFSMRRASPHEVVWKSATYARVQLILKNPAYAGAYVYGRRQTDPTKRKPGQPKSGHVTLPIDKWMVCLQHVYPAFITWELFLHNQERLRSNLSRYQKGWLGVARKGKALLQGITLCARCGARLQLHYAGVGPYPVYDCHIGALHHGAPHCQSVRAWALDQEVERIILAALAPDKIAIALSALAELEKEEAEVARQWQLRLQRVRYEAERAARQYNSVEPEDRLVAKSLEQKWELKLRAVAEMEHAFERRRPEHPLCLTEADRREIIALGEDLPRVWRAETTRHEDRKRLLRMVVKEVIVDGIGQRGRVWFQINWQTGATSEHTVSRRVQSYEQHERGAEVAQRIRELNAARKMDKEIARTLNAAGLRTTRGGHFTAHNVTMLRLSLGIAGVHARSEEPVRLRWEDGTYTVEGVARAVGVKAKTVYQWLADGRLQGRQLGAITPWRIPLTEEQISAQKARIQRSKQVTREAS